MSDLMQAPQENDLPSLSEVSSTSSRSRVITLVAVAAGVVVLGLAAFFLFFSGSSSDDLGGTVPSAQGPNGQQGGGNGGKNGAAPAKVPPVYQGDVGHDPFKALPAEQVVASATPSPTPTPTASAGTGGTTALSPDYYQVSVASIGAQQAKIIVNGVAYTVQPGDRFPDQTTGPFQLVRIAADQKSVTLKFGAESITIDKNKGYTLKA